MIKHKKTQVNIKKKIFKKIKQKTKQRRTRSTQLYYFQQKRKLIKMKKRYKKELKKY